MFHSLLNNYTMLLTPLDAATEPDDTASFSNASTFTNAIHVIMLSRSSSDTAPFSDAIPSDDALRCYSFDAA